MKLRE